MGGVLARIAGVCRYQEERLADDGRRQAPQRRGDQVAAASRAEGTKADHACDRPGDDEARRVFDAIRTSKPARTLATGPIDVVGYVERF